jgi:uncharacterized YigZ family protein
MKDTYRTISNRAVGEYKERGSKFMAFAIPVDSELLAKNMIADIRKKYHDARHHCFAYKIGLENGTHRTNDDGEPSGTAGKPIYGQIVSFGVTNILLVVVRYFGGKLLGTGGLINAYRSAAEDALNHAEIIKKTIDDKIEMHFGYANLNDINRLLTTYESKVLKRSFDENCHLTIQIRKGQSEDFIKRISAFRDLQFILDTNSQI